MYLTDVLARFQNVEFGVCAWRAKCPVCGGHLTIAEGHGDLAIVIRCAIGCPLSSVLCSVGLTPRDLLPHRRRRARP
jgi:hypothetical protein